MVGELDNTVIAVYDLHDDAESAIRKLGRNVGSYRAKTLGAHEVVDHAREDVAARVRALTGRKGADVVFEHVGGRIFEAGVAALARDGRLVTCGATTGGPVALDVNVLFGRHLSLMGSWMGRRADMAAVLRHVASGALEPVVDSVMPLADARAAHERIEARALSLAKVRNLTRRLVGGAHASQLPMNGSGVS